MSAEGERSKIWEVSRSLAIGAGVILLAFVAADAVLLNTGLYMTAGV